MSADGIKKLVTVALLKADEANQEAMEGADKQKSNIEEKKSLRDVQSALGTFSKDSMSTGASAGIATNPNWKNAGAIASEASVGAPAAYLTRFSMSGIKTSSPFSPERLAKNLDDVASSPTRYASGLNAFVEALKKSIEESSKDLEAQDKLGNFEIQSLMSDFHKAETLATSTKKKTDDQRSAVIGKIG